MSQDVLTRIIEHIRHTAIPTAETLELLDLAADEIERLQDEIAQQHKLLHQAAAVMFGTKSCDTTATRLGLLTTPDPPSP